MKKQLIFFIIILSMLILTACADSPEVDYKNLHASFYNLDDETEEISLSLLKNNLTSEDDTITLIYDNLSKEEFIYNDKFQIEILIDNTWYIIPIDEKLFKQNTMPEDYILLPKDIYYHEISLDNLIGDLQGGNYRIIKSFIKDNKEFFKSIEFFISQESI